MTPIQKLPKNVGDLGKIIVAKGFKKLPKVQWIANSGHTGVWVCGGRVGVYTREHKQTNIYTITALSLSLIVFWAAGFASPSANTFSVLNTTVCRLLGRSIVRVFVVHLIAKKSLHKHDL